MIYRIFRFSILALMIIFYMNVGIKHFTDPDWFMPIMPPYIPYHKAMIYISGFFEVLFGFFLIFDRTRFYAAWGLICLLIAVYPANFYLALNAHVQEQMNVSHFFAFWFRLPLQFVFLGLAYWHSKIKRL